MLKSTFKRNNYVLQNACCLSIFAQLSVTLMSFLHFIDFDRSAYQVRNDCHMTKTGHTFFTYIVHYITVLIRVEHIKIK